jgi:hypothetical protein
LKQFDLKKLVIDALDNVAWDDLLIRAEKMQWYELLSVEKVNFSQNVNSFVITKDHVGKKFDELILAQYEGIERSAKESASIMANALKLRVLEGDKEKITVDWVLSLPGQIREVFYDILNNGELPAWLKEDAK